MVTVSVTDDSLNKISTPAFREMREVYCLATSQHKSIEKCTDFDVLVVKNGHFLIS